MFFMFFSQNQCWKHGQFWGGGEGDKCRKYISYRGSGSRSSTKNLKLETLTESDFSNLAAQIEDILRIKILF